MEPHSFTYEQRWQRHPSTRASSTGRACHLHTVLRLPGLPSPRPIPRNGPVYDNRRGLGHRTTAAAGHPGRRAPPDQATPTIIPTAVSRPIPISRTPNQLLLRRSRPLVRSPSDLTRKPTSWTSFAPLPERAVSVTDRTAVVHQPFNPTRGRRPSRSSSPLAARADRQYVPYLPGTTLLTAETVGADHTRIRTRSVASGAPRGSPFGRVRRARRMYVFRSKLFRDRRPGPNTFYTR